jgi:phosphoglycolate phosphatase-like HAD superfamily hydrolase
MRLAVFDIDGTLTLGDGLGTRCFFGTFDRLFGSGAADRSLESYLESTDCGIAREAVRKALGRDADADELERFKAAYLELLAREIAGREKPYRPLPGAERIFPVMHARGWAVAIATGNWRRAAALKLACAGIAEPDVVACSEDATSRAGVIEAATRLAAKAHRPFERVVYVGDQPWDLRAAADAGVRFVGVGSDARRERLEQHGARVVESYEDEETFLAILDEVCL